jgi:hypothetical protein
MTGLGIRQMAKIENLEALELPGSTHLGLRADADGVDQQVSFDLMVDDIEAQRTMLTNVDTARLRSAAEMFTEFWST